MEDDYWGNIKAPKGSHCILLSDQDVRLVIKLLKDADLNEELANDLELVLIGKL